MPSPRPSIEDRIRAALWFAERGFGVFSVWSTDPDGTCRCAARTACEQPGKHPVPQHRLQGRDHRPRPHPGDALGIPSEPNWGMLAARGRVRARRGRRRGRPPRASSRRARPAAADAAHEHRARAARLPALARRPAAPDRAALRLRHPLGLRRATPATSSARAASTPAGAVYAPAGGCLEIATLPDAWAQAAIAPARRPAPSITISGGYELPEPGFTGQPVRRDPALRRQPLHARHPAGRGVSGVLHVLAAAVRRRADRARAAQPLRARLEGHARAAGAPWRTEGGRRSASSVARPGRMDAADLLARRPAAAAVGRARPAPARDDDHRRAAEGRQVVPRLPGRGRGVDRWRAARTARPAGIGPVPRPRGRRAARAGSTPVGARGRGRCRAAGSRSVGTRHNIGDGLEERIGELARRPPRRRDGGDRHAGQGAPRRSPAAGRLRGRRRGAVGAPGPVSGRSTALVIVHHARKEATDDFLASVSGTYGITGSADTIIRQAAAARGVRDAPGDRARHARRRAARRFEGSSGRRRRPRCPRLVRADRGLRRLIEESRSDLPAGHRRPHRTDPDERPAHGQGLVDDGAIARVAGGYVVAGALQHPDVAPSPSKPVLLQSLSDFTVATGEESTRMRAREADDSDVE